MLLSVVLYGSRARGDHRPKSDVDLLGVTESGLLRKEVAAGGTSMYHYPAPFLLDNAERGDLFVLHLVKEGKVLHDTLGFFSRVCNQFTFKDSYGPEIEDASLIMRFFVERPRLLLKTAPRKRLVWALRTAIIARSADEKSPAFSSSALASFSKIPELKDAIDHRNNPNLESYLRITQRVYSKFGCKTEVESYWPREKSAQRALMHQRGGIVADTLSFVQPAGLIKKRKATEDDGHFFYSH